MDVLDAPTLICVGFVYFWKSYGDDPTLPELLELEVLPTAMMSAALMEESPASRLHDSCIIRLGPAGTDGQERSQRTGEGYSEEDYCLAASARGVWHGKGLVAPVNV